MTPEQFCYWLQGRAEMQPDTPPSAQEWAMIAQHLSLTFNKVTPSFDDINRSHWTRPLPSVSPITHPLIATCVSGGSAQTYC